MQADRWLRVFCQDLRVYDEQQAQQGWTRGERDAWVAASIVDARAELRRRGHTWAALLEALEHESPRLRALAPATEDGPADLAPLPRAELITDLAEAERLARGMVAELLASQCPELSQVEVARVRFRFGRRVSAGLADSGVFERTLDAMIAAHLGGAAAQPG
ncbi:MAG: hypothetical protein K8W52_11860 [Deltaproteobacteria bacterium]|nr:hypothetical protein [Deltaproteobacteria bacterium]